MIDTLNGILSILWLLLKIGVLAFIVAFVWAMVIAAIHEAKKKDKE